MLPTCISVREKQHTHNKKEEYHQNVPAINVLTKK